MTSRLFGAAAETRSHWFGTDSAPFGGRAITPEQAAYLGPVFGALRHITDFMATLPVDAGRTNPDGSRTAAPVPAVLRRQNDPGRPGMGTWVGAAGFGLAAHGNVVGWVESTDGFGFPSEITWLQRNDWTCDEDTRVWRVFGQPVPSSRIFHIPWIVPPGKILGLSPIEHYAAIARAGLSAQDYADVQRGGGLPPAILKNSKKQLDTDQAARIREMAVKSFASGKPFVTGNDWDLSLTTIPPSHAQFIATLKLTANQIAAIYGLDPREIGGEAQESLTYSTDESRALNRANNMRPYIVRFEDAINRVLPERQFIKLNVDATIRTDIKTRVEVIGAQLADGRLNLNEARALEDRPPVPGGKFHNGPAPKTEPVQREGESP